MKNPNNPNPPVVAHHEVQETYSNSLGLVYFDGRNVRVNLMCIRMTERKPPEAPVPPTPEHHVVARLVLTPELSERLVIGLEGLKQQVVQAGQGAPADVHKH